MVEPRRWYWLRMESIGYTLVAAVTALAMAFLIVLGPLMLEIIRRYVPLMVAMMFVAWAVSLNKSSAQAPQDEQPAEPWSIYC